MSTVTGTTVLFQQHRVGLECIAERIWQAASYNNTGSTELSAANPQATSDTFLLLGESVLSSALAQLRLKLLDLTGRNRLINFMHQ